MCVCVRVCVRARVRVWICLELSTVKNWQKFNFVVGVVHTNYWNYAINDHQVYQHISNTLATR